MPEPNRKAERSSASGADPKSSTASAASPSPAADAAKKDASATEGAQRAASDDKLASAIDKFAAVVERTSAPPPKEKPAAPAAPAFALPKVDPKDLMDPERAGRAVGSVVESYLNPILHTYGEGNLATQKALLRQEVGAEHFDRFADELDATLNALPPGQRALPDIARRAYEMVRGRHTDALLNEQKATLEEEVDKRVKERLSSLQGGRGAAGAEAPPDSKLTAEERTVCRNMGWTEEEYLKGKELPGAH